LHFHLPSGDLLGNEDSAQKLSFAIMTGYSSNLLLHFSFIYIISIYIHDISFILLEILTHMMLFDDNDVIDHFDIQ